ncbi:uncharacterized protein LOC142330264 isoform X2 [Lycorma delicatula]|uniref:uncharacterized protein LOC142330264 isoform X2 n=1 Tax=Lycorma delicatula TaxID=130591 RepID=UPI003F516DE2
MLFQHHLIKPSKQFAMTHTGEIKKMLITSILSHYLITAGADGIIYCFKLTEPQSTPVIKCPHGSSVTSFVVTKHGYILSGCDDGRLRIWDSTTGLLLRVIRPSANLRPIRNVHYLYNQGEDRVLVNLDTDVFLYEFEHIPAAVKEKSNLSPRNRRKSPGSIRQNSPASFSSRLTPCRADGRSTGYQSMAQRKNYGSHQQKFPSVRILHSSCASNQLNYEDHEELVLKCSDHKNYRKEQRMKALSKRCCTLPKIRNKDAYHDTTNAVLLTALKENPRIAEAAVSLIVPPKQSP